MAALVELVARAPLEGVPSDIQLLAGPLLLGYCFNWGLFGILTMQCYMYYLGFSDGLMIKSLVWGLYFIDVVQTALTTHNAWHFLSSGWGDPVALDKPGWSWIAVPLLSGVTSAIVQIFFAWRIWKLSRKTWLSIPIITIALAQGISAAVSGIWFAIVNDVHNISSLKKPATVWLAGSAVNDVLIAIVMVYLLRSHSTGFEKTDVLVNRLVRLTVETGAITAVAAVFQLVLYLHYETNNLHMIPGLVLSKLYSNTLVATLNSRNPSYRSTNPTPSDGVHHIRSDMNRTSRAPKFATIRSTPDYERQTANRAAAANARTTKVQISTMQEVHADVDEISNAGSSNGIGGGYPYGAKASDSPVDLYSIETSDRKYDPDALVGRVPSTPASETSPRDVKVTIEPPVGGGGGMRIFGRKRSDDDMEMGQFARVSQENPRSHAL